MQLIKIEKVCLLRQEQVPTLQPGQMAVRSRMVEGKWRDAWLNPEHIIAVDPEWGPTGATGRSVITHLGGQILVDQEPGQLVHDIGAYGSIDEVGCIGCGRSLSRCTCMA